MPDPEATSIILSRAEPTLSTRVVNTARRLRGGLILRAHDFAARHDLVPPDFDSDGRLNMADAGAVVGEWLHQLRRRMAFYPEEALAWKVGLGALVVLLVGLAVAVRMFS